MTPFDYINTINSKTPKLKDTKQYIPFIVNRTMSFFSDTIFYANEANQLAHLDSDMQYDYLYHVIPQRSRFKRGAYKKIFDEDLLILAKYLSVSYKKAEIIYKTIPDKAKQLIDRIKQNNK